MVTVPTEIRPAPVTHYENFPVASWLCPPALRPAVGALYAYARTADDLADEGNAAADQRLADLAAYRADLHACVRGAPVSPGWRAVFEPLAAAVAHHDLPLQPLDDLLDAFMQDVARSRDGQGYADRDELLDYCSRSADPVGRLLLHLYGVRDAHALAESDDVCTALQLINFWQDLSIDTSRGRLYLPQVDIEAHGVTPQQLLDRQDCQAVRSLVADVTAWARALMLRGAPLVHRLPGRAGWELRLVVQGGLRIIDKIERMNHGTLIDRPRIGGLDAPLLLWRAAGMRRPKSTLTGKIA